MIVITGAGRSGTSLLARLYQELGFDPIVGGGGWEESINGGLEDIEIGRINLEIVRALKMQSRPSLVTEQVKARVGRSAADVVGPIGKPSRGPTGPRIREQVVEALLGRRLRLMEWEELDQVVDQFAPRLRELAASREVAKDPQFCQTLHVWAAARVPIEQVVVTLRDTTTTAQGLLKTGHLPPWATGNAPNHVAYRVGLLFTALHDHRLEHVVLRFPDYIRQPDSLYESLKLPRPLDRERFMKIFHSLVNPGLVHSWS